MSSFSVSCNHSSNLTQLETLVSQGAKDSQQIAQLAYDSLWDGSIKAKHETCIQRVFAKMPEESMAVALSVAIETAVKEANADRMQILGRVFLSLSDKQQQNVMERIDGILDSIYCSKQLDCMKALLAFVKKSTLAVKHIVFQTYGSRYYGEDILYEFARRGMISKELLDVAADLGEKRIRDLLIPDNRGDTPLHKLVDYGDRHDQVQHLLDFMSKNAAPEERVAALRSNHEGRCLLGIALQKKDIKVARMFLPWLSIEEILGEERPKRNYLHCLADAGEMELLAFLVERVKKERPEALFTPDPLTGRTLMHQAAASCNPEVIKYVIGLAGKNARQEIVRVAMGGSPVALSAGKGREKCLELFLQPLKAEDLACDALGPISPLASACSTKNLKCLELVVNKLLNAPASIRVHALSYYSDNKLTAYQEAARVAWVAGILCLNQLLRGLDAKQRQKVFLTRSALERGGNVLHVLVESHSVKVYHTVIKAVPPAVLIEAFSTDERGCSPLHYAANYSSLPLFDAMMETLQKLGQQALENCLFPQDVWLQTGILTGAMKVYLTPEMSNRLFELLGKHDDWKLMLALEGLGGMYLTSRNLQSFLLKRFPAPQERRRFLMMLRAYQGRTFQVPSELAWADTDSPELKLMAASGGQIASFAPPAAVKCLERYGAELEEKMKKSQTDQERGEYRTLFRRNHEWLDHIYPMLACGRMTEAELTTLLPMLERLQRLPSRELRMQLTKQLIALVFGQTPGFRALIRLLKGSTQRKLPKLHFIPLVHLTAAEVDIASIAGLQRILHRRDFFEGGSRGLSVLGSLANLTWNRQVDANTLDVVADHLAGAESSDEFLKRCRSLDQVIRLGSHHQLQEACETPETFDLEELAQKCFRELVPMPSVKEFSKLFTQYFADRRQPEALISYASRLRLSRESLEQLGSWVYSVLQGTDRARRYDDKKSPHLLELYRLDPQLRTTLPKLCEQMGKSTVAQLTQVSSSGPSTSTSFRFDKAKIMEKVLEDRHLDHKRFSILVDYLKGGSVDVAKARISKEKKDTSASKDDLELQRLLILFCEAKDKRRQNALLRKALSQAQQMKSSHPIGEFYSDLEGACKLQSSKSVSVGDFEVMLTDEYLDLLLIGTDVQGSCQRVENGAPTLLGYMMDGKDIPVVVKKPGSKKVEGRRFLRMEVEADFSNPREPKHLRPALFLERLYSNHSDAKINEAIVAKAKQVAKHLRMPLYIQGSRDNKSPIALRSLGGVAQFSYSDSAGGIKRGPYEIFGLEKLYEPQRNSPRSSCSSDNK